MKKLAKQLDSVREMINQERWTDCVEKANKVLKTENKVQAYVLKAKSNQCHCLSRVSNFISVIITNFDN